MTDLYGPTAEIEVKGEEDIVRARELARNLARNLGFRAVECIQIATAVSELTRNILLYAGEGVVSLLHIAPRRPDDPEGIRITAKDRGPGIPDLDMVLRDGYSTSGGLGLGLPGTQRIMDAFDIHSGPEAGTTITVEKWLLP